MVKERHGLLAHQRGRKGSKTRSAEIGRDVAGREFWDEPEPIDARAYDPSYRPNQRARMVF